MAKYHYVDPKDQDQHTATEGIADHSDLTVHYIDAKKEVLGPWLQEDERQAVKANERQQVIKNLRKYSVLVGVYIGLPVVLGVLIGQLALTWLARLDPAGGDAMLFVFSLVFAIGILLWIIFYVFKWVGQTFYNHNLKALPITITTLASLFFLIRPLFHLMDTTIGGLIGYSTALLSLLVISVFISTLTIFMWTAEKVPNLLKLLILVLFFGVSVAAYSLA